MLTSLKAFIAFSVMAFSLSGCGQNVATESTSENESTATGTAFDGQLFQYIYQINLPSSVDSYINCDNAQFLLQKNLSKTSYFYYYKIKGGGWNYALRPSMGCTENPKYASIGMCVSGDASVQVRFEGRRARISTEIEGCMYETSINMNAGVSLGSTTSSGSCSSPVKEKVEKYLFCSAKIPANDAVNPSSPPGPVTEINQPVTVQPVRDGIWNIYKSLKYVPENSNSRSVPKIEEAEIAQEILTKCNVDASIDLTDGFKSFTKGLVIVYSGPFADISAAKVELDQAKSCGFEGYSKKSSRE
jgi:hypothetical protein